MERLKIVCDGRESSNARIFVDGTELDSVAGVSLEMTPDSINRVNLTLIPKKLEIDVDAKIALEQEKATQEQADYINTATALGCVLIELIDTFMLEKNGRAS